MPKAKLGTNTDRIKGKTLSQLEVVMMALERAHQRLNYIEKGLSVITKHVNEHEMDIISLKLWRQRMPNRGENTQGEKRECVITTNCLP